MEFHELDLPVGLACGQNISAFQLPISDEMYADFLAALCLSKEQPMSIEEKLWLDFPEFMQPNQFLRIYVPPVLLVFGTIGNVLSFVIMAKNMWKGSTYTYLAVLAIMDLLVLYIGLLRMWVGNFSVDVQHTSNAMCKIVNFLGYVSSVTSVWLIIAVTIERFIAVKFPLRAPRMCNVTRARIVIVTVVTILCLLNSHIFWTVELQYKGQNGTVRSECGASADHTVLVKEVWPWVDAAVYSFIPFVIISVLNFQIVRQVLFATRRRTKMQNIEMTTNNKVKLNKLNKTSSKNLKRSNESSKKLTIMLLAVSFTFLLTTLPMNLVQIVQDFMSNTEESVSHEHAKQFAQLTLARTVVELLMYVNHSVNFFLYCATGRKFRKQVQAMLCSCCCEKKLPALLSIRQQLRSNSTSVSSRLSRCNSVTTPKKVVVEYGKRLTECRKL